MEESIRTALDTIILLVGAGTLVVGWIAGQFLEMRHFASIRERERALAAIPASDLKHVPDADRVEAAWLVHGSAVLSPDYYKIFAAGFRMFAGGEVRGLSPVLDRARREALLRMKESAPDADAFVNLRFETSTLAAASRRNQFSSVEVLAYGTAIRYRK